MKLYTRATLGLIAAFVLTYAILGITKANLVDPWRRALLRDINQPALERAADELRRAQDRPAALKRLSPEFDGRLSIEKLSRSEELGWYRSDGRMYSFRSLGDTHLVYGPFPLIERGPWLPAVIALATPIILAGIVAFIVVAPFVRRIRALERVTRRLGDGELSVRANTSGRDALASLSRRFNEMAGQIEGLVENKKELLQAVSHEFRTPTSRIRFALEMLEDASPEERRIHVEGIDESLVEMDDLVDELLTYVRFEGNVPSMPMEDVDAAEISRAVGAECARLRTDVAIDVKVSTPLVVHANRRYFRRALSNLILNATRYAEARVTVELTSDGDGDGNEWGVVSIEDDGPGIPEGDRDRVFEPFARLEQSRSRQSGGAGLGLAIVRRICEWHGATVNATSSKRGARIVMRWPVSTDTKSEGTP